MKLNKIEFVAMNNPIRRFIQDKYEVKILKNITSIKDINIVLEIGCGSGNGTKLIKKYFLPKNIIAIDLDDKMIEIANKRIKDDSIKFLAMDGSKLDFPDEYFDAVFDFKAIHHIPNWKDCLMEIKRVLKPQGELVLEDLSLETFTTGIGNLWRILSDHPYEFMYTKRSFTDFLNEIGFEIRSCKEFNPLHLIRHFSLNAIKK